MRFFLVACLLTPAVIQSQEVEASDILFLKVQELEGELSILRSELEVQANLIDKLLNENQTQSVKIDVEDDQASAAENIFRFEGINDKQTNRIFVGFKFF